MLRELVRNVYAIIENKGVVVIDTTLFPSKARKVLENIHIITPEAVIYIFNTHYHVECKKSGYSLPS